MCVTPAIILFDPIKYESYLNFYIWISLFFLKDLAEPYTKLPQTFDIHLAQ